MKPFAILVSCVVLFAGCRKEISNPLGSKISGAFDLTSPDATGFYLLNSSFTGEYDDGSLAWYELASDGSFSFKNSLSVPRLGTSVSMSADGKLLATSVLGTEAGVYFYEVQAPGVLKARPDLTYPATLGAPIERVQFFAPSNAPAGTYYVSGVVNPLTTLSKVVVLKVSSQTSKLFTLPNDLPQATALVTLAYGAPVYLASQDMFVAFPALGNTSFVPDDSKPADIIAGRWTPVRVDSSGKQVDIRTVSVAAVDFSKVTIAADLKDAVGFFPYANNEKGEIGDRSKEASDAVNSQTRFRSDFQYAMTPATATCFSGKDASTQPVDKDAILSVENQLVGDTMILAQVEQISGWSAIAAGLRALPAAADEYDYTKKVFFPAYTTQLYSSDTKLGINNSRILKIRIAETQEKCIPVWTRMNLEKAITGNEHVYLEMRGASAYEPKQLEIPRADVGFASLGATVVTSSYSGNSLHSFKVTEQGFEEIR